MCRVYLACAERGGRRPGGRCRHAPVVRAGPAQRGCSVRRPGMHATQRLLNQLAAAAAAAVFTEAWEPATGERLLQQHDAPILKLHGNMPQVRSRGRLAGRRPAAGLAGRNPRHAAAEQRGATSASAPAELPRVFDPGRAAPRAPGLARGMGGHCGILPPLPVLPFPWAHSRAARRARCTRARRRTGPAHSSPSPSALPASCCAPTWRRAAWTSPP